MDETKDTYFLNVDEWKEYITSAVCEGLAPRLRQKVAPLVTLLEQVPEVDWDRDHRLVLGGETVPNSNIIDLMRALICDRKFPNYPPGWSELVGVLRGNDISKEFMDSTLNRKMQRKYRQSRVVSKPYVRRLRTTRLRAPKGLHATVGNNRDIVLKVIIRVVGDKSCRSEVQQIQK